MTKTRPQTTLAKSDAEHQANCRRIYEKYDRDIKKYGRPVADFNAGFIEGQNDYQERISDGRIAATLDALAIALADHDHQWSNELRRGYERAVHCLKDIGIEYVPGKAKKSHRHQHQKG